VLLNHLQKQQIEDAHELATAHTEPPVALSSSLNDSTSAIRKIETTLSLTDTSRRLIQSCQVNHEGAIFQARHSPDLSSKRRVHTCNS
jgi:hypothetical protein